MMLRKNYLILIPIGILITSLCWAGPVFQEILSNLKTHADKAKMHARNIEELSTHIRLLAGNIENLSDSIRTKRQREKIRMLENKIDLFQKEVIKLENMTDNLRNVAAKMQKESNRARLLQKTK